METNKFTEVLNEKIGFCGRMISASKSGYRNKFPRNLVVFNANIIVDGKKVWWGDIDLTLSKNDLLSIAVLKNKDIYILYEMDGRFENEDSPRIDNYIVVCKGNGTYELGKSYNYKEHYDI
jgi:hypothetical protein